MSIDCLSKQTLIAENMRPEINLNLNIRSIHESACVHLLCIEGAQINQAKLILPLLIPQF